jgi:hypothetical protein
MKLSQNLYNQKTICGKEERANIIKKGCSTNKGLLPNIREHLFITLKEEYVLYPFFKHLGFVCTQLSSIIAYFSFVNFLFF